VAAPEVRADRQLRLVLALGTTQTLAWASSYYLPAILADPIAHDLGISSNWFFAAFSGSLVISGLLGPAVGRQIDRVGGREVLSASNVILAAGLAVLGASTSVSMMVTAWLLLGVGMGLGLYDAAFGALGRIYGDNARKAITGITLIAGFASTVGWPLSSLGLETIGWRETCYAWAAAHMVIGLPLNMLFLPKTPRAQRVQGPIVKPHIPIDRTMILLSFAFAAAWTVTSAMAAHLPRIVELFGATPAQAVFAGMMIGPAQVAARVLEASTLSRFHPLFSTRLACITHPIGACVIGIFGGGAAAAFALLHGAGNGILTIARGTLPLAIFGPKNYAYRLGLIGAPSRICQAIAPLGFGLLIEPVGRGVVAVSSLLSLAALVALMLLPAKANVEPSAVVETA
jgi:MFS family permease